MAAVVAQVAPRIIIPGFFIGQTVKTMGDWGKISQTIAFSFLFITAITTLFQGKEPWLGIIPGIAAVSYYYMMKDPSNMDAYRYTDWVFTTPLMLLAILQAAGGFSHAATLGIVASDVLMIGAGYIGVNETDAGRRHMWFALGMLAFVPILWVLLKMKANRLVVLGTLAVWSMYPVIWWLSEEKQITNTATTISYSVMDVVSKVGLVTFLKF
jgi:bacteriorhodopsin